MWNNNHEYIPELIYNEDCEPDDEEPTIDTFEKEDIIKPNINIDNKETDVATFVDEDEEEGLSLKSKRFGNKRKKS